MKHIAHKNYYEILDINPGASQEEIEEAYRRAKAVYGEDSVAVYSLYSSEERKRIMKRIMEAYETLRDPVKRKVYDANVIFQSTKGSVPEEGMVAEEELVEVLEDTKKMGFKKPLVVTDGAYPLVTEQYRILYTRLEEIGSKKSIKTFAITSAVKGEGKTVTSLNLSLLMAQEFKKDVILVEFDLRNPVITSEFLDATPEYGLVNVVKNMVDIEDALIRIDDTSLRLLPVKQAVKGSADILGSPRIKEIFADLKERCDYVIVDSPPILPLADMNIISKLVDGIIMVVRAEKTPKDIVLKAINSLPNGNILGMVLNGAAISFKKYYY